MEFDDWIHPAEIVAVDAGDRVRSVRFGHRGRFIVRVNEPEPLDKICALPFTMFLAAIEILHRSRGFVRPFPFTNVPVPASSVRLPHASIDVRHRINCSAYGEIDVTDFFRDGEFVGRFPSQTTECDLAMLWELEDFQHATTPTGALHERLSSARISFDNPAFFQLAAGLYDDDELWASWSDPLHSLQAAATLREQA